MICSIINCCQMVFMPNRFIAENGLVLNMVMEHARWCNRNDIALLLDQEKVYDRVHSSYLRADMLEFGVPSVLVNFLIGIFFGNSIRININGHLQMKLINAVNYVKVMLSCKNKKIIKLNETETKLCFYFNTTVSSIHIISIKIQLNPFQDTLINYSYRFSINKF
jgi:hypothetical protein